MKRFFLPVLLPLAAAAAAQQPSVAEIPYESVPHFLKLPPNLYLGGAS